MVDDDRELCAMIVRYLSEEGYRVEAVHNGGDSLHAMAARHFDLVILDVMLPEMSGQEVLRRLRSSSSPNQLLPVVMLTARGEEVDRIVGLETGADDYIPKPCSLRELAARIRAVLRRVNAAPARASTPKHFNRGKFDIDLARRAISYDGQGLDLTGTEFSVLLCLIRADGETVSKSTLAKAALGRDYDPSDRSIDMHVANLRKKLRRSCIVEAQINTLRGTGYWLVSEAVS